MASQRHDKVDTPGSVVVSSSNATDSRGGGASVAEEKFTKESWQRVLTQVRNGSRSAIKANEAWRMKSARMTTLPVAAARKQSQS